ncbi:hypothetical protein, conserved [Eimeria tenella]|uniref:Uncharacterized protein n=1 Tax=Eimeria tenella TaxID=5802 RepID=U6L0R0_EIMTE|nr:hypothetical protein, conserved [Eimeria tenella]CDJ42783.1 hypothetical protein, conserved [Eimeria tenella]|eukprot:XP_013233533.1 hypothetical protein, conserved [Eimeria tenella]
MASAAPTVAPPTEQGADAFAARDPSPQLTQHIVHMLLNDQMGNVKEREAIVPQQLLDRPLADARVWAGAACTPQDAGAPPQSSLASSIPSGLFAEGIYESLSSSVCEGSSLEKEALSHVRRLQSVPVSYLEVDKFLCSIEAFAARFRREQQLLEIAEGQMDATVRYFYRKRMEMLFPGRKRDYQTLVEVMLRLLCLGNPESFLRRELRGAPPHKALKLYVELGLLYDSYTRLCERTNSEIKRTEDSLAQDFLSRLPNRLAEQTRRVARNVPSPNLFAYAVMARTVDSHLNGNW